ncbi:MAG: cyanophycinase [Balneolaceae bacterium]|nr:cyanophycinase [Balneolaceae bacterium]
MKNFSISFLPFLLATVLLLPGCASNSNSGGGAAGVDYEGTRGPASGSLVVVGGSMQDPAIFARFIDLAGGWDANIVVVPTAAADSIPQEYLDRIRQRFADRGVQNLTVLHTKDRELADSEAFTEPVRQADGVWFTGGRQWRIVDSYMGTLTQQAFEDVLERGGVIGGSSAGATIQGSYLARGDSRTNTIMMGDHEEGFAYIENVAIDQHLLQRNRQFDLVEIIEAKPHLLGIGLDENTAIVVQGDVFEVMGESFVAVYDASRWEAGDSDLEALPRGELFQLLDAGQRYNMRTRTVLEEDED